LPKNAKHSVEYLGILYNSGIVQIAGNTDIVFVFVAPALVTQSSNLVGNWEVASSNPRHRMFMHLQNLNNLNIFRVV
jgi:hypothetical protein